MWCIGRSEQLLTCHFLYFCLGFSGMHDGFVIERDNEQNNATSSKKFKASFEYDFEELFAIGNVYSLARQLFSW